MEAEKKILGPKLGSRGGISRGGMRGGRGGSGLYFHFLYLFLCVISLETYQTAQ